MLTVTLRERDEAVLVDLGGKITLDRGDRALREVVEALLARGRRNLVLNLAGVDYVDSSGLGELVRALRAVRAGGGRLKVLTPANRVFDTLAAARLLPLFEVYASEEDVLKSFAAPPEPDAEREVLHDAHAGVLTVTLNRPRRFNALTRRMVAELITWIAAAARDRSVRAVVLTGAGRAFCYGADAEELRQGTGAVPTLELFQALVRDLGELPKPVLAAVNGFATGAGLDLALAADLRVMAEKAKLASAFVRFGLVPDGGSTHHLPRLVGPALAAELVLTGRAVGAEEALRAGLVNRVHAAGEVLARTQEWAAELARGPARAMGRAKRLLRSSPLLDLPAALAAEAREQAASFADEEFREGLQAHLERRDPSFRE